MSFFQRPTEVRRSFDQGSRNPISQWDGPRPSWRTRHIKRNNLWPKHMQYGFLERCKELVCSVPHPTNYYKHKDWHYRLSILPWSRGSYLDIRMYAGPQSTPVGILLHLDIMSALLPEIIAAVRRMEADDTRSPEQKAQVEIIPGEFYD